MRKKIVRRDVDLAAARIIEQGRRVVNAKGPVARMVEDLDDNTVQAIADSAVPDEFAHLASSSGTGGRRIAPPKEKAIKRLESRGILEQDL